MLVTPLLMSDSFITAHINSCAAGVVLKYTTKKLSPMKCEERDECDIWCRCWRRSVRYIRLEYVCVVVFAIFCTRTTLTILIYMLMNCCAKHLFGNKRTKKENAHFALKTFLNFILFYMWRFETFAIYLWVCVTLYVLLNFCECVCKRNAQFSPWIILDFIFYRKV